MAKYIVPRLTSATKDAVSMGRQAVKLLLARIDNPTRPRQRVNMAARVILRESIGPAPSAE
jgi:LacI family transcriptional regulator